MITGSMLGRLFLLLVLFTMPALQSPTSSLQVEVRDLQSGRVTPARIYLTGEDGTFRSPDGAITYKKGMEQHFICNGRFGLRLPPGKYLLEAERGPEYIAGKSSLEIRPGQDKQMTVKLERWISMNGRGWFSGDLHNHRQLEEMPQLLLAEDLNLAPTLADWIWEDKPRSTPPQTSEYLRQVDQHHVYSVLDKEVERLKHGPGAVDLLGLKSVVPFEGDWLYPPNDRFCERAHQQGGYVDAEKILWRDVCALVALGHVDFAGLVHNHFNRHGVELETESWGMIPKYRPEFNTANGMPLWSMDVYYKFLNCGFRLPASAGSASGVKAAPLGYNRVYVNLSEPFSYSSWMRGLKAGRSFATNGPMLFLKVNGREPGDVLRFPEQGGRLEIQVQAVSARPLDRLEIVGAGAVLKTITAKKESHRLSTRFAVPVMQAGGWLAARCFEKPDRTIRFAHTSPVYIEVGKDRRLGSEDAKFFIDWIDREIQFYEKENRFREPQHREEMIRFFRRAREIYEQILAGKTP